MTLKQLQGISFSHMVGLAYGQKVNRVRDVVQLALPLLLQLMTNCLTL